MLVSNLKVYLHSMQIKNKKIMYMYLGDVESLVWLISTDFREYWHGFRLYAFSSLKYFPKILMF